MLNILKNQLRINILLSYRDTLLIFLKLIKESNYLIGSQ